MDLKIELLYFDDCPTHPQAEEMVKKVLKELEVTDNVEFEKINVDSYSKAEEMKFLGSPSIRVNGVDIEPDSNRYQEYQLACRIYRYKGGTEALPHIKWIKDAIKKARAIDLEKAEKKGSGKGRKYGAKPTPRRAKGKSFKKSKSK